MKEHRLTPWKPGADVITTEVLQQAGPMTLPMAAITVVRAEKARSFANIAICRMITESREP